MAPSGKRRLPEPQIKAISPNASPDEAAAVMAAISRFLAENAPAREPATAVNRWQRAALLEGVDRAPGADVWGQSPR